MWNPFKKKDPLEGQRANYALAFDIIPKVINAFSSGNISLTELENVSTFMNFADGCKRIIKWKKMTISGADFKSYQDKHMIIIRFPEPFTFSSAKAGIIVVDKTNRQTRYFTLEASFGECMIVEILGTERDNTGITIADKEDLTEFASIVYQKAIKQDEKKSASTEQIVNKTEQAGAGESVIALSLNALIEQMSRMYTEWNGLFTVTPMSDHVLVRCHKGFEDTNTRKAIPCLWRRKSFIENCKMFNVKRIVFLDSVNSTFDELRPMEIDVSALD